MRRRLGDRERTVALAVVLVLAAPGWASVSIAQDWPSWRGPADDGMARGDAPVAWDENQDVKWKVDIPGHGQSSPVVWGNQIFVTTAIQIGPHPARSSSRGRRRSPHGDTGPQAAHRFVILSIDRTTGEVLWERTASEATPQEGFHPQYGSFASNSPVTDGEYVFAYFGSRGLYCYDLDGRLIWQRDLGQMRRFLQFGEGTPLVLRDDRLIVKADHEGDSFIAAFDKATGEELWRTARDEATSWSPPLVVEHEGHTQVIVAATGKVRSYDYDTGAVIWEVSGLGRNQIPAPVHQDDLVFVMSGFIAPNLMAIRLGGQGDLTGSDAVVWTNKQANSYTPSPVLFDGQLYVLTDRGVLTNFDATTGHVHYRERLPGPSNFKASPIGVNGRLYLASEEGRVFVVKMGSEFALLATNTLEDQMFIATPAIVDGEVFLRSQVALYCISPSS